MRTVTSSFVHPYWGPVHDTLLVNISWTFEKIHKQKRYVLSMLHKELKEEKCLIFIVSCILWKVLGASGFKDYQKSLVVFL